MPMDRIHCTVCSYYTVFNDIMRDYEQFKQLIEPYKMIYTEQA